MRHGLDRDVCRARGRDGCGGSSRCVGEGVRHVLVRAITMPVASLAIWLSRIDKGQQGSARPTKFRGRLPPRTATPPCWPATAPRSCRRSPVKRVRRGLNPPHRPTMTHRDSPARFVGSMVSPSRQPWAPAVLPGILAGGTEASSQHCTSAPGRGYHA